MILINALNASVNDIRNYNKNIAPIKKIKRSTLLRELSLTKKELNKGNYYKEIIVNSRTPIFSKEYFETQMIPLTKKISETIIIPKGNYNLKEVSLINSTFNYKHKLLKSELTLLEDIVIKKGTVVTPILRNLQEIFELKPYVRRIYPSYLILENNKIVNLERLRELINSFKALVFKKLIIRDNSYIMNIEKVKLLVSVLSQKIRDNNILSEEDKKLKEDLEVLSFQDIFSLFKNTVVEEKKEEVKIEKKEEVVKKVEEDEDLDFF